MTAFRTLIENCGTREELLAALKSDEQALDDLSRLAWLMWKRPRNARPAKRETPEERRTRLAPLVSQSRAEVVARVMEDIRLPDGRKFEKVQWFELEELKVSYRAWAGLIEWCQRHVRVNDETVTVGSQIKAKVLRREAEIRGLIAAQTVIA